MFGMDGGKERTVKAEPSLLNDSGTKADPRPVVAPSPRVFG